MQVTEDSGSRVTHAAGLDKQERLQKHSCQLCQSRKVKCDRRDPCSKCIKAHVECIFKAPIPPRKRKRDLPETDLLARLNRVENLIKSHGTVQRGASRNASTDSACSVSGLEDASQAENNGKLIVENGVFRYLDNSLWTDLNEELQNIKLSIQASPEESKAERLAPLPRYDEAHIFFGLYSSLYDLHPRSADIFRLWQAFIHNVDPLTKILHVPTVHKTILDATSDLQNILKSTEALMFSIYFTAVVSMTDEDCNSAFGETREALSARYRFSTQQALMRAGFLRTTSLVVLQAYVIYLFGTAETSDPPTQWTFTGVAMRIGQRLGLHRDCTSKGLLPFDIEMYRRLWLAIIYLDVRVAKLSGVGGSHDHQLHSSHRPTNINDSDFCPEMRTPPVEHEGLTDMLFLMIRFEVAMFLQQFKGNSTYDGYWQKLNHNAGISMAEKDNAIDELEDLLEQKYLRYCDPLIPLHQFSSIVARATIDYLRFSAHHPRQYADRGKSLPQSEKDMLFATGLKVIKYDNLMHAVSCTGNQRFVWFMRTHFKFEIFIYVLSELRRRTTGDMVDDAWLRVELSYANNQENLQRSYNPLCWAIGDLVLNAWNAREAALGNHDPKRLSDSAPSFITRLRAQRMEKSGQERSSSASITSALPISTVNQEYNHHTDRDGPQPVLQPEAQSSEASPLDWNYWDGLVQEVDTYMSSGDMDQLFIPG